METEVREEIENAQEVWTDLYDKEKNPERKNKIMNYQLDRLEFEESRFKMVFEEKSKK